ncbi:hypothetical protein [Rhodoferax sp. BAB1]|uniref:hypothetical protein n=1 Tax=Rhodoferax sp. BAB1 TaxID=2741720 RepID=UPI001575B538|nr:hypothetical protein [Rhodoferax sp. BAB1]QKO21360.1 hypothetical protein HTY51_05405 [Rhodoferax sp. BAB1]
MDSTYFIAWWGAIVATTVLIWDVVKWARSTAIVRLVVRANTWYPDSEVVREKSTEHGVSQELKSYLHIELSNVGSMPTTIMGIEAQKALKKGTVSQSGPTFVPHYGNKLPYVLRPGEVWSCRADQEVLFGLPGQAPLELFVYLSHKAKPVRKRIPTPTNKTRPDHMT